MNTPSRLLNKLAKLFTMDTTPKSMESIKEGIIQETTTTEELTPIDGEELKVFNKITEEQKQEIRDSVGGDDEYDNMMTWVAYYLPEDEEDCYQWICNAGQVQPIIHATARVYEKYQAECKESDSLESFMAFCHEIRSVENHYSPELVKAFSAIRQLEVDGFKDYLQLARVMCSYAEHGAKELVEKEMDKKKPNMMGIRYATDASAVIRSAKEMLWNIDLPHEMKRDED